MIRLLEGATLVVATMAMGLMAGVFSLYAHTIMPGLLRTDDRTFVGAFQAIDRAIINPWFLPTFLGALVITGLAALFDLAAGTAALGWIVAALALYSAAFAITVGVHLPLNDGLKAAGDPARIGNPAAVRERFHEGRWVRWNVVRAVVTTVAFACLTWALVQLGRALPPS